MTASPASPEPIEHVVRRLGLGAEDVEPQGWYKGKLALGLERRLASRPRGKYVDVTAITPTPLGEGKTVTAIGLAMALCRLGKRSIVTLREPSRAPVFGIKGGGAGGGGARLLPFDDVNLHLTGDLDAVAAAHNLLAAIIDNHVGREQAPLIDPKTISWRRVCDVSDRALSGIVAGVEKRRYNVERETGFDLTAASEVMAILALATSVEDLRERLGRIVVGFARSGEPVRADDLGCTGAMTALLRDALRPNLVQTSEQTPALVHTGPFANIAHGNGSVLADLAALPLADYVVTESGFGADCGAEKLFHIKCRVSGLRPDAEVLVCSARAVKAHSGRFRVKPGRPLPPELEREDLGALRQGACNLAAHVGNLGKFGLGVVVAVNRFPGDHDAELDELRRLSLDAGARSAVVSDVFEHGGAGGVELARAVMEACDGANAFHPLFEPDAPIEHKLETLGREIYGADGVELEPLARQKLARFRELGFGAWPVCVAKTQYSLSHDPARFGRPSGYRFPIRDLRLSAGAGFVYALAGNIRTMPGLPAEPAASRIDVDADGRISGLT